VARVAGAEAAIELAGTAEEHIAATKVQAIQRVRVARAQLAAKKAASAAKLADVDAKLAAEVVPIDIHLNTKDENHS